MEHKYRSSWFNHPTFRRIASMSILCLVLLMVSTAAAPVTGPTPTPPVNEHPEQAILHPAGIFLGLLFATLMINLFRWMFRVPPQLPFSVVKARQSVSSLHRILVPTRQEVASERVVELACRLGERQKAEIVLTYVIEVPFTLSLNTSMPVEEKKGQEALDTAHFIVAQHGLPVKSRIIHHRSVWGGILAVAREEMVDAIVMNVSHSGAAEGLSSTAQEVAKRAECEVIFDRAPRRHYLAAKQQEA